MTSIKPQDVPTTQEVLATLRDLLNTMRDVLTRMPAAQSDATDAAPGKGDVQQVAAEKLAAQELVDVLRASTKRADPFASRPFFQEWAKVQRDNVSQRPTVEQTAPPVSYAQQTPQSTKRSVSAPAQGSAS